MDTERVREALAKLKAEHFPELEIDVFFERVEAVPTAGNDNSPGDGSDMSGPDALFGDVG